MHEPRCLDCGYILTGLSSDQCPECSRFFDLNDRSTFTTKPLFDRWRFWLPGFLLAIGTGAILYPFLIRYGGFGWWVTFGLPVCIGVLVGYSCRVSPFIAVVLALTVFACIVFGLFSLSLVGVYCAAVLAAVALGPLIVGTLLGAALRMLLKQTKWDQRWHLPMLVILLTLGGGLLEMRLGKAYGIETVETSVVVPSDSLHAWNAVMFYEEVKHQPPWLMRVALPHPLYTSGGTAAVGDKKVCVYSKGRLVKKVTAREPEKLLAFDVVEQTHIENRSVRLTSGSFAFSPIADRQTRITLSTSYQPLLGPRWAWRWAEEIGVHTLHGHVLEGMRLKAMESP